jgi:hypothetical protein
MGNHSNINNQFIPYELALELKKLGFNEKCFGAFNKDMTIDLALYLSQHDAYSLRAERTLSPLWQQAFDWFREKYNLHYIIYKNINIDGYDFCEITTEGIINKNKYSYEEARLECLKKLIEIVKRNTKSL